MADRHRIFSFNEAAEYLGVSPRTLRTWIKEGKIRSFKLGNLVKIHGKDLKKFINERRRHDAPADRKVRKRVVLEIYRILDDDPDLARCIFGKDFPDAEVRRSPKNWRNGETNPGKKRSLWWLSGIS